MTVPYRWHVFASHRIHGIALHCTSLHCIALHAYLEMYIHTDMFACVGVPLSTAPCCWGSKFSRQVRVACHFVRLSELRRAEGAEEEQPGLATARVPHFGKWGGAFRGYPVLSHLDCYWVGSLGFNFLGNQGVFLLNPQKVIHFFCRGVNSIQDTDTPK